MVLRRLARDQWVRLHGTPRVTVLVGGDEARALWDSWIRVSKHEGTLVDDGPLDRRLRSAVERASTTPSLPVAVIAAHDELTAWRAGRTDRIAAMVDEGLLHLTRASAASPAHARTPASRPMHIDARSAAEAAMFEALQATPATAGRFALNEYLSVSFGSQAAEVDLLSRTDRIAIEIDGIHHFEDLDRYRRDRRKDLLLQSQGLFVVRVLAEDVLRDARPAVTMVCQALAYRRDEELRR
ncbi:MAG: DUF559 domain-containing protein [Kofleriaceae bacterium]|nr:DUF559 domain-containing protein [Kofleriaceae bacterium]